MDGEEIDSWSDLGSGDEWLCAQLQKSGLMSKHKRRKQSCKEDNKIIKLGKYYGFVLRSEFYFCYLCF